MVQANTRVQATAFLKAGNSGLHECLGQEDSACTAKATGTSNDEGNYEDRSQRMPMKTPRSMGKSMLLLLSLASVVCFGSASAQQPGPSTVAPATPENSRTGRPTQAAFLLAPDKAVGLGVEATDEEDQAAKAPSKSTLELLGDVSMFSKDETGVMPAILNGQTLKFVKARGQGEAVWYAVQYNDVQFIVLEISGSYPARIISPNGAIVDISSQQSRSYPTNRKAFATVTTPEGKYFVVPDPVWDRIRNGQLSNNLYSPPVTLLNSNAMVSDKVASSSLLVGQVVNVIASSSAEDLLRDLASEGQELSDVLFSSARGYRRAAFPSFTDKGKQDIYRVCVYCLVFEAENDHPGIGKSKNFLEVLSKDDGLADIFWQRQHTAARHVFIPDRHPNVQSLLVPKGGGEYYALADVDVEDLLVAQLAGKLTAKPFLEGSASDLSNIDQKLPKVIHSDKVYLFVAKDAQSECASRDDCSFKVDETLTDIHKVVIADSDLEAWYAEGRAIPGLFVKNTVEGISQDWPFLLIIEDGVVNQYFLNARMVKVALSILPSTTMELQDESIQFIQTKQGSVKIETFDDESSAVIAKDFAVGSINDKPILLTNPQLMHLYSTGISGIFSHAEQLGSVPAGHSLVNLDQKNMLFSFGGLKSALAGGLAHDSDVLNQVRHMLELETTSTTTMKRTIKYNPKTFFVGDCAGSFVNESVCQGTFTGDYHHCKDPKMKQNCEDVQTPFVCKGSLSRKGCDGDLQLDISLNNTQMSLLTKELSPLALDECGADSTIEFQSDSLNISITCKKNFQIQALKCVDATVVKSELLDEGQTAARSRVTCEGSLDLSTLECISSPMNITQCLEPVSQVGKSVCGDRFVNKTCQNGGDFEGCYLFNPKDEEFECVGGKFDGTICTNDKHAIDMGENTYYISSICKGDYVKLESCKGEFSGQVIKCGGELDLKSEDLCTDKRFLGPVFCKGSLNKEGCDGEYNGVVTINGNLNFSVSTGQVNTNFKDFPDSDVTGELVEYIADGSAEENGWKNITLHCKKGLKASDSSCQDAEVNEIRRTKKGWESTNVTCAGQFKLDSMACETGQMIKTTCVSTLGNNTLPQCWGDFLQVSCPDGESLGLCAGGEFGSQSKACKGGYWNGSMCFDKELVIPVTETKYYVGTCNGTYTDNESCTGKFAGRVAVCDRSYLSSMAICDLKENENFLCSGFINKHGCQGTFDGLVEARGDVLRLTAESSIKISIHKVTSGSEVQLKFINSTKLSSSLVKLGVDRDLKATCYGSFDGRTNDCVDAEVSLTNDYTPNTTYVRARCYGRLNLDTLDCVGGQYSYYSCNGSQTFPANNRCRGIYIHLDCKNGGKGRYCHQKTDDDVEVYCDGAFQDGFCKPFFMPQLEIIMINTSYFIKGSCSSRIANNECQGIFTGDKVVTCSSKDATVNKTLFDACQPIPNESFGSCTGKTGSYGCKGIYKTSVEINSSIWDIETKEEASFDLKVVHGSSLLTKRNRGSGDNTYSAISCQGELVMKDLTCNKTILQFIDSSYEKSQTGIAQTVSSICLNSDFDIKNLACLTGEYLYYDCVGKSHKFITKEGGVRFTCLGDLKYSKCALGGQQNRCTNPTDKGTTGECINSYFDGEICLKDKPAENSELIITPLGSYTTTDTDGQEVIVENFEVEKFHMFGAIATEVNLSENMIDKLKIAGGSKKEDGSVIITSMSQEASPIKIDEGVLRSIRLVSFALDELPMRRFAVNDAAQFIKVHFKDMLIHQFMFSDLATKNSVIRRVTINDKTQVTDYGVEELRMSKGFGSIELRDVELYLPYISAATLDNWESASQDKLAIDISLPRVDGVEIFPFKIVMNKDSASVYFEFPEMVIKERSLDLIKLDDFILSSRVFTSNPVAAEEVVRNYEQFIREHPEERNDLAEASFTDFASFKAQQEKASKPGPANPTDGQGAAANTSTR